MSPAKDVALLIYFHDTLGALPYDRIQPLNDVKPVSWFTNSTTSLKLKTSSERYDTVQVAEFLLLAQGACGKKNNRSYILAL